MTSNIVSVVVPVFNVEKYLPDCIESILAQTFKEFELILVDDGSTDRSGNICDYYALKDKRIKVFHKQNSGVSDSRNVGIKNATGKYLSFVDGDDLLNQEFLQSLLDAIDGCQIAMCYFKQFSDGELSSCKETDKKKDVVDEHEFWDSQFGLGFKASCCNKLFLTKLFDNNRFDVNYSSAEDDLIIHKLTGQCSKIAIIHKPLYYYRMRSDSATHTRTNEEFLKLQTKVYLDRCSYYLAKDDKYLLQKWYLKCFDLMIKNYRLINLKNERKELKEIYKLRKKKYDLKSKTESLFFWNAYFYFFLARFFKRQFN